MEPVGLIYEAYSEGQGSNGCQKSFISVNGTMVQKLWIYLLWLLRYDLF